MSDLGGVFGLWLGMSVFTVLEFLEYFIDVIVLACSTRSKGSHVGSSNGHTKDRSNHCAPAAANINLNSTRHKHSAWSTFKQDSSLSLELSSPAGLSTDSPASARGVIMEANQLY